jgi:signal transduction histidine kinase
LPQPPATPPYAPHVERRRATDKGVPVVTVLDQSFSATTYTRMSSAVRLVAGFAAMHSVFFQDAQPQRLPAAAGAVLIVLFSVYALWLYWRTAREKSYREHQSIYWIDALWYLGITVVTGGPNSPFYFFLAFPLLFVALRWGFRSSFALAICASVLLLALHLEFGLAAGTPAVSAYLLLPPLGLLVLGCLMAIWARADLTRDRRLSALEDFNTLFNPRFSIEQMIDRVVRHMGQTHDVKSYALVLQESGLPAKVFRAELPEAMYPVSDSVALAIGNAMSQLDTRGAIVYSGKRGLLPPEVHCSLTSVAPQKDLIARAGAIAERFGCKSYCSVQFNLRQGGTGRLVVWSSGHHFGLADLQFFHQLGEQLAPRIENVQLLDRLAGQVADAERQKISRDIHDSAIQPYIGLKFGLEALARKVPDDNPLSRDIARMVEMATIEIRELRTFVKGLRGDEDPGRAALVPALQRQAARFGELYGISVTVESPGELRIGDALANEVFHIVSEALSNIRRHTTALRAHIKLSASAQAFILQVSNPCEEGGPPKRFTPRSIAERTRALGGVCTVTSEASGDTLVTVNIPQRVAASVA